MEGMVEARFGVLQKGEEGCTPLLVRGIERKRFPGMRQILSEGGEAVPTCSLIT